MIIDFKIVFCHHPLNQVWAYDWFPGCCYVFGHLFMFGLFVLEDLIDVVSIKEGSVSFLGQFGFRIKVTGKLGWCGSLTISIGFIDRGNGL